VARGAEGRERREGQARAVEEDRAFRERPLQIVRRRGARLLRDPAPRFGLRAVRDGRVVQQARLGALDGVLEREELGAAAVDAPPELRSLLPDGGKLAVAQMP